MEPIFKNIDEVEVTDTLCSVYNKLLFQLKGRECHISKEQLEEVQSRFSSELLLFMYNEADEMMGTAQVSFICTPSRYTAYVNTVVIDETYRGQGLGKVLMDELEKRAKERWQQLEKFTLTSSPQKGTQGFYLKLGYRMRTKEAGDETIVYVKDIE